MTSWQIEALGTHWQLIVWDENAFDKVEFKTKVEHLQKEVLDITKQFEKTYSRFLPGSLVTKLNKDFILENPPRELLQMLECGEKLRLASGGYFDLCIAQTLNRIGYASFETEASLLNPKVEFQSQSDSKITFSPNKLQLKPGFGLDLGGIGKGFLVDKLAAIFPNLGFEYFLINAGGDIFGTTDSSGQGIECLLENPSELTESIGTIIIKNQAIASSSSNRRRWSFNLHETKHHLIDPWTSDSKQTEILAVYTQAPTCLEADLGSTAIFVSPLQFWPAIKDLLNLEFLVVKIDESYWQTAGYAGELY